MDKMLIIGYNEILEYEHFIIESGWNMKFEDLKLEKQLLFDTSFEIGNGHWSLISKSMFCDFSLDQYMLNTYNATRILIN